MAHPKISEYCKITSWLEDADGELLRLIDRLCMVGQLRSPRGGGGVTFLYPSEKARKELKKLAATDASAAVAALKCHIIPAFLPGASDFASGEVVNRAGLKVKVEKAAGGKVHLEKGAVLERPTSPPFSPRAEFELCVLAVTKGEVPTDGEPGDLSAMRKKRKGKSGGAEDVVTPREECMSRFDREFKESLSRGDPVPESVYFAPLVGLLSVVTDPANNLQDDFLKMMAVLDYNPQISLAILLEPYRKSASVAPFISDRAVDLWVKHGMITSDPQPSKTISGIFSNFGDYVQRRGAGLGIKSEDLSALVYRGDHRLTDSGLRIGSEIVDSVSLSVHQDILKTYSTILSKTGGFPETVKEAFKGEDGTPGGRKLWQDVLRYHLRYIQYQCHEAAEHSRGTGMDLSAQAIPLYNDYATLVQQTLPGKNPLKEVMSYIDSCPNGIPNAAICSVVIQHASSSDFLYVPVSSGSLASLARAHTGGPNDNPARGVAWIGSRFSQKRLEHHQATSEQGRSAFANAAAP